MTIRVSRWSLPIIAVLVLALVPAGAGAHAMPTSAVLLDIQGDHVSGQLELPLSRLAIAMQQTITPASAVGPLRAEIDRYAQTHIAPTGTDGRAWKVAVSGGAMKAINGVPNVVLSFTLTPPGGTVTDFDLKYDVITNQLVTHRAIATVRTQWDKGTSARNPQTLGVFDWNHSTLRVDAEGGSWWTGFASTVHLGVEHIRTGADHLLFLLMLLIPAPLVASGGRWRRRDDGRRSTLRVLHVVTAFAVGHSTTLALATLGVVHAPSRVVESLIALSIFVSAVHAIRPLVPGGEAMIAAGFGLVHGLAFATLLGGLGLSGGALVSSLLGFNLGIELTQLLVVALMMPSLYVLSRTSAYPAVRTAIAGFGLVVSGAWFLERTSLIGSDPFASITNALIDNQFAVAAAFALLAASAFYLPIPRLRPGALSE